MKNRGLSEDQVDEMTREAGVDKDDDDYINYKNFIKVMETRYYIIRVSLTVLIKSSIYLLPVADQRQVMQRRRRLEQRRVAQLMKTLFCLPAVTFL